MRKACLYKVEEKSTKEEIGISDFIEIKKLLYDQNQHKVKKK